MFTDEEFYWFSKRNDILKARRKERMAEKSGVQRKKALIEEMQKDRGYMLPQWNYMIDKDFDFMEAYNTLYKLGLTDGKALPAKTREFVAMGILAFRGDEGSVYEHCKRALRLGATKQELLEAIETTMVPGGAPTFSVGLKALMRIEEDERKTK